MALHDVHADFTFEFLVKEAVFEEGLSVRRAMDLVLTRRPELALMLPWLVRQPERILQWRAERIAKSEGFPFKRALIEAFRRAEAALVGCYYEA